ncbi:hypothetical protein AK812_SmicGene25171 [Symbiodinium microadriaticum]|uniref:Uncharacterized protein n=1 Tax=Symbiodinium microadriaticum TaxID=2951 RepID=A0A1Q9DCS2_SYMMI|nr:hypothetical protein AK812_SmicGene25171 [Symbiodinium microadriaticum]
MFDSEFDAAEVYSLRQVRKSMKNESDIWYEVMKAAAPTDTLTLDEFKGGDRKQGSSNSSAAWAAEPAVQTGCLGLRHARAEGLFRVEGACFLVEQNQEVRTKKG